MLEKLLYLQKIFGVDYSVMIMVFLERVVIFIVQMYNTINQYFTPPIYYVKNYKFSLIKKRIQVFYFNSIIYLGKLKTEKILDSLCIAKNNKG